MERLYSDPESYLTSEAQEAALAIVSSPSFDWNVVPDYLKNMWLYF